MGIELKQGKYKGHIWLESENISEGKQLERGINSKNSNSAAKKKKRHFRERDQSYHLKTEKNSKKNIALIVARKSLETNQCLKNTMVQTRPHTCFLAEDSYGP